MNTPKIRFKGFTDDWEQRKLGTLCSLITKGTTPKDKSGNGEVNFIKVENINPDNGEIIVLSKISTEEHERYLKRSKLEEDDILFSIAGTLGRVSVVKSNVLPANTNQAIAIIRVKEGYIPYLTTVLKGPAVEDFIRKNPTIGAQPNLSLEQVNNLDISYPKYEEQVKIGEYFKSLDHLITLHQRKCDETKELKKYMLQKMFPKNGEKNPEIRFEGFTDDWEQRKLGEIVLRESLARESTIDLPYVEYEDVIAEEGRINKDIRKKEGIKKGIFFDGSQVLYGKLRPYLHNWLNPDFSGVAVGDWWVLKPNNVDKNFIYRLIQTQQFDDIANQSTGSKMPRADWNLVSNTEFAIPTSQVEQTKIGGYFFTLDNLITLHQRKCEKLKELKKFMLQNMFV